MKASLHIKGFKEQQIQTNSIDFQDQINFTANNLHIRCDELIEELKKDKNDMKM